MMDAWVVDEKQRKIVRTRKPIPRPGEHDVTVKVLTSGVCRTDLHVIDGDLPTHKESVVPGHQVVGRVIDRGRSVRTLTEGDLVGIAWLASTCGVCEWCREGRENLCPNAAFTGWDRDGGFAEYAMAHEAFAYRLPADTKPVTTAPLLCAGIIGYRALSRANLPDGGRLGVYGFGSSGHITAKVAMVRGCTVFAMTRGEGNRQVALDSGAAFVADVTETPPEPLDSAIVFAPAGDIVPHALRATKRGGTVVLAGIHMSQIPSLDYDSTLFGEKDLRSVTANTRADGEAFLRLAHNLDIQPNITTYGFDDLNRALDALRAGEASGSLVITMDAELARQ
jgi:alcohol dehydrogenase, propanol-preferring